MKDRVYIGELSRRLNVSKRTILYYEDIGLIKSTREPDSNYRLYDKDEIIKLQQIILFKKMNLPLNEIYKIITLKDTGYAVNMFKKHLKSINSEISDLNYSKNIIESFINICNNSGVQNINVIELLTDLTCVDRKYEDFIGFNSLYEINLEIYIGSDLIPIADINCGGILIESIKNLRAELKSERNISIPLIRICDKDELDKNEYVIKLHDFIAAREKIDFTKVKDNCEVCSYLTNSLKKMVINNIDLFAATSNRKEYTSK